VAVVTPRRALVLDMRNMAGIDWVWQFGLPAPAIITTIGVQPHDGEIATAACRLGNAEGVKRSLTRVFVVV
jgi:hypothetical protein